MSVSKNSYKTPILIAIVVVVALMLTTFFVYKLVSAGSVDQTASPVSTMHTLSEMTAKSTDGFAQDQDSLEAIAEKLGEDNNNNSYNSSTVTPNANGSILERVEYIIWQSGQ